MVSKALMQPYPASSPHKNDVVPTSALRRLLYVAGVVFCAHIIWAVYSFRGLIWDGHSYFFNMMQTRSFFLMDALIYHRRDFARIAMELPTLMFLWTGVGDKPFLMRVFSATLLLHPLLSGLLCWHILRKHHRTQYILFPLFAFFSYGIVASVFAIYEPFVMVSLSWPVLFLILFAKPLRPWEIAFLLLALVIAFRAGEVLLFILPLLMAALLYRLREGGDARALSWLWKASFAYIAITCVLYIHHLLHMPPTLVQHVEGTMLRPTLELLLSPSLLTPLLLCLGSAALMTVYLSPRLSRHACKVSAFFALLLMLTGSISLACYIYFPYQAYQLRAIYAAATAFFQLSAILFTIAAPRRNWALPIPALCVLLGVAVIFQSLMQMKTTYHWIRYVTVMESEVATKSGYVPYEESALNAPDLRAIMENMNLFWCSDTLSVLLNAGTHIHTIIGNRDPAFNKPFDPLKPENYEIVAFAIPNQPGVFAKAADSRSFDYTPFFTEEIYKRARGAAYSPFTNTALPDAAFNSEIECPKKTVHFSPWQTHRAIVLKVTNASPEWWPSRSSLPWEQMQIMLRPHLYDTAGHQLEADSKASRSALPYPLAPGHSALVEADIQAEALPEGTSVLVYDLVQENVAWFAAHHGKTCSVTVQK